MLSFNRKNYSLVNLLKCTRNTNLVYFLIKRHARASVCPRSRPVGALTIVTPLDHQGREMFPA